VLGGKNYFLQSMESLWNEKYIQSKILNPNNMSKRPTENSDGAEAKKPHVEECAICLEDVSEAPSTVCGHKFHRACLTQIAIVNAEKPCPLCRCDTLRTPEQSAQKRKVDLHLRLLEHSSTCLHQCPSENCAKMKRLSAHLRACRDSVGCENGICKRMIALLTVHARRCRSASCVVQGCAPIRRRIEQAAAAAL
jgi:hypothetical protein